MHCSSISPRKEYRPQTFSILITYRRKQQQQRRLASRYAIVSSGASRHQNFPVCNVMNKVQVPQQKRCGSRKYFKISVSSYQLHSTCFDICSSFHIFLLLDLGSSIRIRRSLFGKFDEPRNVMPNQLLFALRKQQRVHGHPKSTCSLRTQSQRQFGKIPQPL